MAVSFIILHFRLARFFVILALRKLRQNENVSRENISLICALLDCQPEGIMEYVEDMKNHD
ncbi:MAG: helix-turn-helix domain-containing protein [Peptococcaceae bacterium]|nr:helix-turn-helix domain-containing protein [Peptococcaceae bacterium]